MSIRKRAQDKRLSDDRPADQGDEALPFDDALRVLLAAPPQHKIKLNEKGESKPCKKQDT